MNVHDALSSYENRLLKAAQAKDLEETLRFMPTLTGDLHSLAIELKRLRVSLRVWIKIFAQNSSIGYNALEKEISAFVKLLQPESSILSKTPNELNNISSQARVFAIRVKELLSKLGTQRSQWKLERKQEVHTLRSLIKIPDLFLDEKECEEAENLLDRLTKFLERSDDELSNNFNENIILWKTLKSRFESTKERLSFDNLANKYKLSAETVQVIQGLVDGQTLTLDQISAQTLTELSSFTRFQTLIQLSFAPEKRG